MTKEVRSLGGWICLLGKELGRRVDYTVGANSTDCSIQIICLGFWGIHTMTDDGELLTGEKYRVSLVYYSKPLPVTYQIPQTPRGEKIP